LNLADTRANDMQRRDQALYAQLYLSLLRRLNAGLRSNPRPNSARVLQRVRDELRANAVSNALRQMDRAWRCLADDSATWAPIYGLLLTLVASVVSEK
jgi:hypothetical protein